MDMPKEVEMMIVITLDTLSRYKSDEAGEMLANMQIPQAVVNGCGRGMEKVNQNRSSRGGRSSSAAKIRASRLNIERARAAKEAKSKADKEKEGGAE